MSTFLEFEWTDGRYEAEGSWEGYPCLAIVGMGRGSHTDAVREYLPHWWQVQVQTDARGNDIWLAGNCPTLRGAERCARRAVRVIVAELKKEGT